MGTGRGGGEARDGDGFGPWAASVRTVGPRRDIDVVTAVDEAREDYDSQE